MRERADARRSPWHPVGEVRHRLRRRRPEAGRVGPREHAPHALPTRPFSRLPRENGGRHRRSTARPRRSRPRRERDRSRDGGRSTGAVDRRSRARMRCHRRTRFEGMDVAIRPTRAGTRRMTTGSPARTVTADETQPAMLRGRWATRSALATSEWTGRERPRVAGRNPLDCQGCPCAALCGLHDATYAQPSCCRDPAAV